MSRKTPAVMVGQGIPEALPSPKDHLNGHASRGASIIPMDALTAEEMADELRTTARSVHEMRRRGHLIGLRTPSKVYRYPHQQLVRSKLVPGLAEVIEACGGSHEQTWSFLRSSCPEIGFENGFVALAHGAVSQLLAVKVGRDMGSFS